MTLLLALALAADDPLEFFEKKVRPILVKNCYTCHSASTNAKGGLRVDSISDLLRGGGGGPAVVPGDPDKSLLLQAVNHEGDVTGMPPKKRLTPEEIADLRRWIKEGAAWPKEEVAVSQPNAHYDELRRSHWAWQPLRETKVPIDASWARSEIDRFIHAKLEEKGLAPAVDAPRSALLRRLTFDLTGLPPTPEELDAFLADGDVAKVVDRLLASPAYGERWGRHWLDVARYGESTGSGRNVPYPHAWRYRDYVIDAFNADLPYDEFIVEQIAGDLLPSAERGERDRRLIATGFLALGVKDVNQRFEVRFVMDNVDEQIDTVTRSVLALTASCARCHDHKFDPIPTKDYYALAGIFRSSELCAGVRNKMGGTGLEYYDTSKLLRVGEARPPTPDEAAKIEAATKAVADAKAEVDSLRGKPEPLAAARIKLSKLQRELLLLTDPALFGPAALGVRDAQKVGDTEIRLRGEAEKLGPLVPRGYLSLVDVPGAPAVDPARSGRLELARWLTHPKNPLTPRVMVNRVWAHLFGRGLVSSVDNFGVTGDVPSHPELLDFLAARFVREGWSVKTLIKDVVTSRAYQMSCEDGGSDPDNRWISRHAPRRLDAEEIRDAMLAASGALRRGRPAAAVQALKVIELKSDGPEAARLEKAATSSAHRSVYLPLLRCLTPRSLEVFDYAGTGMVTGRRDSTTVATQALYLLNDPFVERQARLLAERLSGLGEVERIELAYRLTLTREATSREVERARAFLSDYEAEAWPAFLQALLASAEFRYVP